jgi:hypothetical protein
MHKGRKIGARKDRKGKDLSFFKDYSRKII